MLSMTLLAVQVPKKYFGLVFFSNYNVIFITVIQLYQKMFDLPVWSYKIYIYIASSMVGDYQII